jgi:hypothetical protein
MGLECADPRQRDVPTVGFDSKRSGGEPAGVPGTTLSLDSWKAYPAALSAAGNGVGPVVEGAGEPVQAGGVSLLAVLSPPGSNLTLSLVPLAPKGL